MNSGKVFQGRAIWRTLAFLITLLLFITAAAFYPSNALADRVPPVILRTSLEPESPVIVGQQVQFNVDILVDTWFTKAPQIPEIKVADAITLLPNTASFNFNERISGKAYSGQRRTYYIFPQQPGLYEIPPIAISVVPAYPNQPSAVISLFTDAMQFMAQLPPELAAQKLDHIIATPSLRVETSFDRELKGLHIGDAFQYTVTISAADTLGSVLPTIDPGSSAGLTVYPDPPKVFNQFDRGRFRGTRTESITYVVEQPGRYQLPEQQIVWWNIQTQSLETKVLPAIMVSVPPSLQQIVLHLAPFLTALAGLFLLAWYYRQPLLNQWRTYRQQQAESEKAYFRRLHQACLSNNPQTAFNQLMEWLDRIARESGPATLDELLIKVNDTDFSAQIAELEQRLFSQSTTNRDWSGKRFYQAIAQVRKRWLQQHQSQFIQTYELQPLNLVRDIENATRT